MYLFDYDKLRKSITDVHYDYNMWLMTSQELDYKVTLNALLTEEAKRVKQSKKGLWRELTQEVSDICDAYNLEWNKTWGPIFKESMGVVRDILIANQIEATVEEGYIHGKKRFWVTHTSYDGISACSHDLEDTEHRSDSKFEPISIEFHADLPYSQIINPTSDHELEELTQEAIRSIFKIQENHKLWFKILREINHAMDHLLKSKGLVWPLLPGETR